MARSAPAPFLTKTYQLVDDPVTEDVISWNENGTAFVVWKTADFARDLLPNYFKHNNFSSFVRQLNTYGFRKVVPDKWEFMNENFRRGEKELLSEISRRKTAAAAAAGKNAAAAGVRPSTPSNSGEDFGSTSTSSPDSKNPGSVETAAMNQFADLTDENEKLKKDNENLSSELAQAKKQCEELIAFLAKYAKLGPDQINRIMQQGSCGSSSGEVDLDGSCGDNVPDDDEKCGEEDGGNLKLFGVWVKGREKKRGREENVAFGGLHATEMENVDFHHAPLTKSNKVCN